MTYLYVTFVFSYFLFSLRKLNWKKSLLSILLTSVIASVCVEIPRLLFFVLTHKEQSLITAEFINIFNLYSLQQFFNSQLQAYQNIGYGCSILAIVSAVITTIYLIRNNISEEEEKVSLLAYIFYTLLLFLLLIIAASILSSIVWVIVSALFSVIVSINIAINLGFRELPQWIYYPVRIFFDWIIIENSGKVHFKQGWYFSLIVAVMLACKHLQVLWRKNTIAGIGIRYQLIFMSFILGLGFLVSLYSFTNFVFNLISFQDKKDYIKLESKTGFLTLRIISYVILYRLTSHTYKYVFNKRRLYHSSGEKYNESRFAAINFSQIGFYVLVFSILLYSYTQEVPSQLAHFLNLTLFFIIDDWSIIYFYASKFGKIGTFDNYKIKLANAILLILSIGVLRENLASYWLWIFLFSTISLANMRYKNAHKIPNL